MLTQQLRELEHDGLVIRTVHQEVPPKVVYAIDPAEAKPLRALTKALGEWASYWVVRTGGTISTPVAWRT
jgi:DNA-binding HxlR family transcriptional regulator